MIITAIANQHIKAQARIPGIGDFMGFSESMSTWEGDHCSIYIEKDGTISTSNSCWSGPKCDYQKGNHTGKVSMESLKKFTALLGEKDMIVPYVRKKENNEGGGKKVTRELPIITTSKGDYILNIMENSEKVKEIIWQMRCEAGIENESYLIDDKTYIQKIVYYYPNQAGDYQSYFNLTPDGGCWYAEVTGNTQSTGNANYFEPGDMKKIMDAIKADKTKFNTPIVFTYNMPAENKKLYHLIYTNKGVFEITDEKTLDTIFALFKTRRAK